MFMLLFSMLPGRGGSGLRSALTAAGRRWAGQWHPCSSVPPQSGGIGWRSTASSGWQGRTPACAGQPVR